MNLVSEKDCARIVGWALPIKSPAFQISALAGDTKTTGLSQLMGHDPS